MSQKWEIAESRMTVRLLLEHIWVSSAQHLLQVVEEAYQRPGSDLLAPYEASHLPAFSNKYDNMSSITH